jgi:hypothetical protein
LVQEKRKMNRLALVLITTVSPAFAHLPVLDTGPKTLATPFEIEDAEHSKAIYAILDGDADYYRLDESEPFDFYVGLTAAKLESCGLKATFSVDILDEDMELIDRRIGDDFEWWPWFEKFGKNWYWIGPEIGQDFRSTAQYPAGVYFVRVYNRTNTGKYVLAIGDDERFEASTFLKIRSTVAQTQAMFWDEADCN